ncbi:MAG: S8 family serine peptidase, partial [Candidatus Limnocylindrales bacterium]
TPTVLVQDAADAHGRPDVAGQYLVMLRDGADTTTVASRHRARDGIRTIRTFGRAFRGFSARLDRDQRLALLADPNVAAVVPDEVIELTAQTTPTGVSRVGAKLNSTAAIDGLDTRVDADVAIIDTGVAYHPDLNVAGGYNCASSDPTAWRDNEGHGTHVAGTVAALDNDFGVVGVAPGARIWGVRILNDDGYGKLSWYVCGLDWVLAQRDPDNASRPLFEAVNMSVTKSGSDDGACGTVNSDILHAAICRVTAGGITVVAAAANDSGSATKRVPASYNEVITVSALADTDGKAGGLGGDRCYSWGGYDQDDTFADFSNYGHDIDIIAPGKCIWSTRPGNAYAYLSGTSMAAPAVTGAVALYKASRPTATPAQVKEALQALGNLNWATSTDPDSTHEKLLDVSQLGPLGSFAFAAGTPTAAIDDAGGAAILSFGIDRSATYVERVRFAVTSLPSGWSAAWAPSSLIGFTAESTTLSVNVPAGTLPGTYNVVVSAQGLGTSTSKTAIVVVGEGNAWHGLAPVRRLDTRSGLGLSGRFLDGTPRSFVVTGGTIPSDVVAVTGNLTVTGSTGAGYVSIGPVASSKPATSTINIAKGQTLANGVTVQVGGGGRLAAVYIGPNGTSTHLVFDVTGYFRADGGGATWYPTDPSRVLDTRASVGMSGSFANRVVRTLQLAGESPVPTNAVAVSANVTVTGSTAAGYLAVGPSMTSSPSTSTLNFSRGATLANNLTLRIGSGGKVSAVIVGTAGLRADVILDVTGYYLAGEGGAHWYPVASKRLLDTRSAQGLAGRFVDGTPRGFQVAGGTIPTDARAITGNLTATGATGSGYVAAGPTMSASPTTSTLNLSAGRTVANGLALRLASGGQAAAVFQGPTGSSSHLILDVTGYFR